MRNKLNGILPLLAALLVLFSSMWRPETTLVISVASLILLSLYYFLQGNAKDAGADVQE